MSFLPCFNLFFLRKNGLRFFPLGREPLCPPPRELLGKQTASTKAEKRRTTCKRFKINSVTGLEMLSSQHWSLKPHNVIFAPF